MARRAALDYEDSIVPEPIDCVPSLELLAVISEYGVLVYTIILKLMI